MRSEIATRPLMHPVQYAMISRNLDVGRIGLMRCPRGHFHVTFFARGAVVMTPFKSKDLKRAQAKAIGFWQMVHAMEGRVAEMKGVAVGFARSSDGPLG